jgi:preprotein translocase subunit SecD
VSIIADPASAKRSLGFKLTPDGARRMEQISAANDGRRIVVILDQRVIVKATIRGKISENVVIDFGPNDNPATIRNIAGRLHAAVNHLPTMSSVTRPTSP